MQMTPHDPERQNRFKSEPDLTPGTTQTTVSSRQTPVSGHHGERIGKQLSEADWRDRPPGLDDDFDDN